MNGYEIISIIVAVVGLPLIFFKKTNLYGVGCVALYFVLQGFGAIQDGKNAVPLFFVAIVAGAGIAYRTYLKK